jgi:hypothetical protein
MVRLEPEDHVVPALAAIAIQLPSDAEGDRTARVVPALVDAKAQVLPLPHGAELSQLAGRQEQGHARVAEAERRQPAELFTQIERQLGPGNDRVHPGDRLQVFVGQMLVGVRSERIGERLDALRLDREAGGSPVPPEALEVACARREAPMQIESRCRAA